MTNERLKKPSSATVLKPWHWFILSAAVPLAHCASRLELDLWHDEIYTVDHFVSRGPLFIVSDYSLPNNHVLYSLILWPFYILSDVNFMLRLPSFLFTAGTLAIVFAIALRSGGVVGAVLSTSLLGLNQMFLIHTLQVRGYGISMFLTAWLTSLVLTEGAHQWRRWFAVAVAGAAFLYVMPTNLLFFAPLAVASVLVRLARRDPLRQIAADGAAWFVAALVALACYSPIATQVQAIAKASSPSSWSLLPLIMAGFLRPATHDYIWFAPLIVASLVALAWPTGDGTPRRWILPALGLGIVAAAFLLTAMLRISPFERNYCPLLVPLGLSGGWLLAELVQVARARLLPSAAPDAAAAASLALAAVVLCPQLWTYPRRLKERREQVENQWITDGYYCYYAADYRPSALVRHLAERGIERVPYRICYTDADFLNLWWYFAHTDLYLFNGPPRSERVLFAIVPAPEPWETVERDCRLTADHIRALKLVDDFGFYRLYQSAQPIDVGWPPDADPAIHNSFATAQ